MNHDNVEKTEDTIDLINVGTEFSEFTFNFEEMVCATTSYDFAVHAVQCYLCLSCEELWGAVRSCEDPGGSFFCVYSTI